MEARAEDKHMQKQPELPEVPKQPEVPGKDVPDTPATPEKPGVMPVKEPGIQPLPVEVPKR